MNKKKDLKISILIDNYIEISGLKANLPLFEKYFGSKLIFGSTGKDFRFT